MKQVGLKYGVICGLVYIIYTLIGIVTNIQAAASSSPMLGLGLGLLILAVTFYVIFLGVKEFRDDVNGGGLTFGEAIKLALLIAVIAAVLTAVFNLFYQTLIDPDLMDRQLQEAIDGMEERGMTDEQIEGAMRFTKVLSSPGLAAAITIAYTAFWGLIKGLIAGAILKREAPPEV